ncbi:MAG TPA: M14 family metallopeptidase [Candidatus Nanopelagicales bacterium]|nr:M14 family metallopeptidase [Candidatus Nanopelagicales bacterium]
MRRRLTTALVGAILLAASMAGAPSYAVPAPDPGAASSAPRSVVAAYGYSCRASSGTPVNLSCVIGRSVDGRTLVATRQGSADATRVLVVLGQMHGEEWPGPLTVDLLRTMRPATGTVIWSVRSMNPDGGAVGRRWNSHGVNLNSNFPDKFLRDSRSGPRALSEPESQAVARFLTAVQPDLVISLHGFSEAVDTTGGGRRAAYARTFSALSGITPAHVVPCGGPCHGNLTDWYTATSRTSGVAFTVEMPRSSRVVRACGVAGHPRETPIRCTALAALTIAARLPA